MRGFETRPPTRRDPGSLARSTRRGVLAAVVLGLLPLTACSGGTFPSQSVDLRCGSQAGGPVTLAVGARANSPVPMLPPTVVALLREAAKQSHTISVVRVDGAPTVAFQGTFHTEAANDVARNSELEAFVRLVNNQITGLTPKTAEADVLAALNEAARITPEGGTVVLVDSGLQTTGQLRFQDAGMFGADPQEVVDYLKTVQLLPSLSGRSVVLVGLGNTAEPQEPLDASLRTVVTTMWRTIAEKAGASCVEVLDTAASRTSVATDVPVTVVALPKPKPFNACGTTVLEDGTTVGFLPDQAKFRDPAAARKTLQDLANLVLTGNQLIELVGTTASAGPTEAGRVELSRKRAEAVKSVLVELGVAASRITTRGAGSKWPGRINDRAPDGTLIPAAAARNRSVVVILSCPSSTSTSP